MFGSRKVGVLTHPGYNGGKGSEAPDYGPLAQASKESAQIMAGLGREQLDFARQQYNEAKPLFEQIVGQQMRIGDETFRQGQEDRQYMIDTFRPLEKGLVADAEKFNTDAYREQLASQAAADAGRAFGNTQAATARAMASMGVNPNSGKFAAMNNQNALGLAAMRANAMTGTRQQAENVGYARKLDAAGLGRNLTGASQGAYSLSLNAGNAAGQNQMAPGNQYMQGMGQGASTIGSGRSMLQSGLGNILNSQTNMAMNSQDGFADVLGAGLGAAAKIWAPSDIRLKENIERVGETAHGLGLYEFNYIGETGRYRGVMAQEVAEVMPDAVSTREDGMMMVDYSRLGLMMEEV